mgnify:FL=1
MNFNTFDTLTAEERVILQEAYLTALSYHREAGKNYSGYDYSLHIDGVLNVARKYIKLLPPSEHLTVYLAICFHDGIEDCGLSYNAVKDKIGEKAANIVYNVTNELGKNRQEKVSKTFPKIKACIYATFTKLCDRMGNIRFSYYIGDSTGMFKRYVKESPDFYKELHNSSHPFQPMWDELMKLVTIE